LIGSVLGAYLSDELRDGISIGLGWGETLNACLTSLVPPALKEVSVVSLLGGLSKVSAYNPSEFAWRFADKVGAKCYLMAAPIIAPDKAIHDGLMNHPGIMEVRRRAERLDLAIVSVGHLNPGSTLAGFEVFDQATLDGMQAQGAVGDLFCRLIDKDGNPINHPVNERVIAVDVASVRAAKKIVLASGGTLKKRGVAAALKTVRPHVLITDETVADYLVTPDA
jgi:DNA-binding transcriptional regulator LsrR (DeoR family)